MIPNNRKKIRLKPKIIMMTGVTNQCRRVNLTKNWLIDGLVIGGSFLMLFDSHKKTAVNIIIVGMMYMLEYSLNN
ncbi:hypothetical protein [Acetilactobacillus jinshanensis]|uniref:Uncharacterized protein n=1 Tax=Acetilactobacillus jinshanensis TaxID=1720083 RepID=A0A4P6ZK41_9LACO|nr:hypothetical protein [Acetilactobacillus jinshanensis]QBP17782.1 hypothetical protein ELX58_01035 [Acetilactobacillus jinshanensis]URL60644.1 hypothetical protein HGK75_01060 [uncultured bacterium]